MSQQGKLIVIEGADGSGKSVQVEKLKEKLEEKGEQVAVYDFPQYEKSFFGKKVAEYLNGQYGGFEDMHPFLPAMLFAVDRFEAKEAMDKDLQAGKVVICNRYMSSNLAHGGAKLDKWEDREQYIKEMEQVEFEVLGIPKPDLVVVVAVPAEVSQKLVEKRGERSYVEGKDMAEEDVKHQREALKVYRWLVENRDKYRLVECMRKDELLSIEQVAEKVWQVVKEELSFE